MQHPTRNTIKLVLATILLAITVLTITSTIRVFAIPFYPYTGNTTFLDKPGFPVEIEEDQIEPGGGAFGAVGSATYNEEEGYMEFTTTQSGTRVWLKLTGDQTGTDGIFGDTDSLVIAAQDS